MKLNKIKKYKKNYINSYVYHPYYHKKIDDNLIYIDSMNGRYLSSDMFRIIEELSKEEYNNFKVYIYSKKENIADIDKLKENYNLKIDKVISDDIRATYVAEYAKYIITDDTIRFRYTKRDEQIIINIHNKNPLLKWGMDDEKKGYRIASFQRPFLLSDYILINNEYSYEKIMKSLLIEDIYEGKILRQGSPRNIAFFKENNELQSKLNPDNNQIFVYMPRYPGKTSHKKFVKYIKKTLKQLDDDLNDNQVLFFKVDGYKKSLIDFSKFKQIKAFPIGYDDYDIINLADALISDYSRVILDFIILNRKIVLFNNFEADYSTYLDDLDLPFIKIDDAKDLIKELNSRHHDDYSTLSNQYAPYDIEDSAKNICQHIFLNQKKCCEEIRSNTKPNVLIFIGTLSDNEITLSLRQLLLQIDVNKYNVIVTFHQWSKQFKKNFKSIFKSFPKGIQVMPMANKIEPTFNEEVKYYKFLNSDGECNDTIRKFFIREFKRQFYDLSFDFVLNYDGYFKNEVLMLSNTGGKSSLWIHNNPIKEIEKGKFNYNLLKEAYSQYDNLVVVSSELIKPVEDIENSDRIYRISNLINIDYIENRANEKLKIDKNTRVYTSDPSYVKGVLERPGKKIITINKSIYDKQWSEKLLNAFDKLCDEYDDVQLIIVGDFGWFNKIQTLASNLKHWKNVTLIKTLSNPLPILKKCDLFILSPNYRFYRKSIFEAEMLKVPIMSMNEDAEIIEEFNGYKIENTYDDILNGLKDFMNDKIDTLDIDYNDFNDISLDEFYELIK